MANKVRLFAVKLNKRDRKGMSEIETCNQYKTPEEFWQALTGAHHLSAFSKRNKYLGSTKKPEEPIVEHVAADFVPERKRIYQVQMGMGFIELPQLELPRGILRQDILHTKNVYVLDCTSDVFLWIGKKANRLLKMAGQVRIG